MDDKVYVVRQIRDFEFVRDVPPPDNAVANSDYNELGQRTKHYLLVNPWADWDGHGEPVAQWPLAAEGNHAVIVTLEHFTVKGVLRIEYFDSAEAGRWAFRKYVN